MVRWPGKVAAGRTVVEPVVNTDWLPTLLELAGLPAPNDLDGVSFAGLLTNQSGWKPRRLFWHFPHYTNQGSRPAGAVRDGDWKLIEHYEDGRVELFNLARDLAEAQDLSAQEPQRVAQLREALAVWRQAVGAQTNAPNPDFDLRRYRELDVDVDVSRYDPATADARSRQLVLNWRKQMNAVLSTATQSNPR
jgi:arylsulfatase A-like enzyme